MPLRFPGSSNTSDNASETGSRLIPSTSPEQSDAAGILLNGSHSSSTKENPEQTHHTANRRCSFKEPLPQRPDKNERRSSISMGVAARAALLSNQQQTQQQHYVAPEGYNPCPEHIYSPADIIPGLKKAWRRMSAKNSTTNTNNASALDKAHEAAELSDAHLDTASKVWPDVFDDDSSSNSSGHSSNGQSASTAATSEASTQDNKERLPSDHCIPEHEDEGFETPKGSQSRSRRASMDTSMYPSNHRPSAAVLGFDSSLRRSDLSPNRSPNNPQSDGHDTPKRSGSSTSTSTALCRKASTMAPEDVDAAPPLQKRRTQTDDNDEAMDKGENLPVKASTTEKQCLRRFCV